MTKVKHPDAIWPGENYFVCHTTTERTGSVEIIVQSESTAERADHSVNVLNEHERNNARRESYYWRTKREGEVIPTGDRRSNY
ncbi:MAG: hypothetical protein LC687_00650 [Actinobacteria bacterium]|nr:hypothetical protein [Actinomycetota bacterium]